MKKKTLIMVLTGCMVLSPVSVYAADATETTTEAEVTETAAQEDSADSESTGELGDDIYSFSMEFDGQIMKFPMTYQEFTDMGWELSSSEDPDTKVSTNSYGMLTFNKGASSVYADVINLGINEVGLEDCLIGGISVDGSYDVDLTAVSVKFAAHPSSKLLRRLSLLRPVLRLSLPLYRLLHLHPAAFSPTSRPSASPLRWR